MTTPAPSKKYTDLVIDLETLSTRWNATVLSIGYQFFSPLTFEFGPKKEILVEYAGLTQQNHHVCNGTKKWWSKQGEDAKRVLTEPNRVALGEALNILTADVVQSSNTDSLEVWGNGSSFDITIMDFAFRTHLGREAPWRFYNVRDVRTLVKTGQLFGIEFKANNSFVGVKHNAADDAEHEAKYITDIITSLNSIAYTSPLITTKTKMKESHNERANE